MTPKKTWLTVQENDFEMARILAENPDAPPMRLDETAEEYYDRLTTQAHYNQLLAMPNGPERTRLITAAADKITYGTTPATPIEELKAAFATLTAWQTQVISTISDAVPESTCGSFMDAVQHLISYWENK